MNLIQNVIRTIMPRSKKKGSALLANRTEKTLNRDIGLSVTMQAMRTRTQL